MPVGFFEALVRPSIPPDTRPTPSQVPATTNLEDRLFTLNSQGAKVLRYSFSQSFSFTKSKASEKKRTFDVARVSNASDSSQFVDVEVVHRLKLRDALGNSVSRTYSKPQPRDNVQILQENQTRSRS